MADIIQLLPDSVANQIAAGEVIQRPASVVKELVENSIDAKATSITINIKDSGRTLVQIIDNGTGMSETDARLSFERHSTSKIKKAEDLFAITTMGFRGEALASIAAVASVELKTKLADSDIGTQIIIEGSRVLSQEPVICATGTNFAVKNLFFNIPARRKFLKSNATEFGHIISEFERIALANSSVEFKLYHNDSEIFILSRSNIRQRIISVFGKRINQNLVPIEAETSIIKVKGFIGKPENARKRSGEQFFFINNRFMRNPYLHKAITDAYKNILPPEVVPSYFLYLEAAPDTIDVNIHPTKTEIKFEDQQAVWQILHATVKQSLGKNNIVPSIDFDLEHNFEIPVLTRNTEIVNPKIDVNPMFNPFDEKQTSAGNNRKSPAISLEKENLANWEKLYDGFENEKNLPDDFSFPSQPETQQTLTDNSFSDRYFQFKGKYILTPVKSGLMVIDQKRAHERILFEKFMLSLESNSVISQRNLFPKTIELDKKAHALLMEIKDDIKTLGFDIKDIGENSIIVNGLPADSINQEPEQIIDIFLNEFQNGEIDAKSRVKEKIAQSLAKASAISSNQSLTTEEMQEIVDLLFACSMPNFSPFGKKIISIIKTEEIEKRFS
ncbi:MAG: DNA mismatch repair protein MutL [Bacteroidetes bacterium GWC2_33_15]|nr:MAG: DNA mismatch repair protein MutL [Bacteroidetes bacterium GWA2_33_15]OFX52583.1 MAG: DNA mismatch repair protein MutL [Bacteroidetes bacterium GWC2_33_15]OFX63928.1 MAG: DNA mismatch repair protein MutL [Bacteroidetes bacterium GWB2_32_14]OFX70805.1 MAG: DNA mismatch repair protein MutL [Bacteroidetes bacterium GWD2_33_33]HAN19933.1 DNA mismatch repair endonuclease MutL [Bacteroidales bacterium]